MPRPNRNLKSSITGLIYKSRGEMELHELVWQRYKYEPRKFPITITRTTNKVPDFVDDVNRVIIEYKGRIRERRELTEILCIRDQYPEYRYVMVIENPNCKAYRQAKGKNTLGNWLTNNGIEWYHGVDGLPEELKCTA